MHLIVNWIIILFAYFLVILQLIQALLMIAVLKNLKAWEMYT